MSQPNHSSSTLVDDCTLTTLRVVRSGSTSSGIIPLTFGIDLPRGRVHDTEFLELCREDGTTVVLQATPLARWSDKSVKWALIDVALGGAEPASSDLTLRCADPTDPVDQHTRSSCKRPKVTVKGGRLSVSNDGASAGIRFELNNGRVLEPRIQKQSVETDGPVRRTECIEGTFPRMRGLRFVCRVSTYRESGLVRLDVRLHNPNRARHAGGLWDLGDPGSVHFDAFDVVIEPTHSTDRIRWQCEPDAAEHSIESGAVLICQDSSGEENWRSPAHVNADGQIPCRFRGYQVHAPGRSESGLVAQPTVSLDGMRHNIAVAVPEFREQFPSSLAADASTIRVGLFPLEWNDHFELQGGEQKTQTVFVQLGDKDKEFNDLSWCNDPPRVSIPVEWHVSTEAFPYFRPSSDGDRDELTELLEGAIYGSDSLLERRGTIDEYGWRHFGDVHADHEQAYFDGETPVVSHYNNQFDSLYGAILQYARTGDPRWYHLFDPLARHVIDIDIYHTSKDRSAYSGGLFWHTDHYADAGTCTHRTYSGCNTRRGQSYGGGPSNEHNYTTGLLYYYWMTGNADARDAVLSLADWVINVDDGRQTVFGLACSGATGGASATGSPDYHGPGRGAGNSLNALLDAWQLTGNARYLDFAEVLIRRVIHPDEDIAQLDLLNAESRWSYTVFLSALAKYLDLKHEAGQLDGKYEYAAASLAHFGRWMAEHERPYLDRPEELEYPTETWAAQEMRKANVLRLAARYCDSADQQRMLARGHELADRAWEQLQSFDSKAVARSLAIMLTEGPKDTWLQDAAFTPFERNPTVSFPARDEFVPQRIRLKQQLRSGQGIVKVLLHASNPTRWLPFLRNLHRHL